MKAYGSVRRAALLVALAAVACGDPDSTDGRGYTKAPLEHPSVLIRGEEPGSMSKYGNPNRVVADVLELPEEAAPAGPVAPAAPVTLPSGVTQEMVAQGTQVYSTGVCIACHGATAGGTPLAPALNDAVWLNIDGEYESIVEVITTGVAAPKQFATPMMPMGGGAYSTEQVRQIAAYLYSISRPPATGAAH